MEKFVLPTVGTICILVVLMEVAGEIMVAMENWIFRGGDYKNSFGVAAGKLRRKGETDLTTDYTDYTDKDETKAGHGLTQLMKG